MTASSICTALTGNAPAAVSPASMMASAPSSTALAASLTSARVGLGSTRIDSNTCVATMAGKPERACAPDDLLLHARHLLERHLEAEIAARDHHALRDPQDGVEVVDRGRTLDLGDERRRAAGPLDDLARTSDIFRRLHEAQRHEVHAEAQAELQVVDVFVGQRRRRQRHAGSVDALVPAERSAVDDDDLEARRGSADDLELDAPVVEQQAIARLRRSHQLGVGREDPARLRSAPGPPPRTSDSPSFNGSGRSPASGPVRIFGPLRSCMMPTCRPACEAISRMRAKDSAWDSCVPCEKLSRNTSTPAATSASSTSRLPLAGPTVAMILVWRMIEAQGSRFSVRSSQLRLAARGSQFAGVRLAGSRAAEPRAEPLSRR